MPCSICRFNLGSIQAFSRSAFAMLIPEGFESQFYALYAFVDRGSSCIGPALIALSIQLTGSIRSAFLFPLVSLFIPAFFISLLDTVKGNEQAKEYAASSKSTRRSSSLLLPNDVMMLKTSNM